MGGLDLGRPRKIFGALPDMLIMFGDIPRSIAIYQSKREGHTTPQSIFIIANVSPRRNFEFDAPSEHILPKILQKGVVLGGPEWLQMGLKIF